MFHHLQPGDSVTRFLTDEALPHYCYVIAVHDDVLYVGIKDSPFGEVTAPDDCWQFDRTTGVELDKQLGWGPEGESGSFLGIGDPNFPENCRILTRYEVIKAKLSIVNW